jgi:hypothetical protein
VDREAGELFADQSQWLGQLGETKIQNLNVAVATNHDVFRFDIAMDNSCGMRRGECAGGLNGDIQNLCQLQSFGSSAAAAFYLR